MAKEKKESKQAKLRRLIHEEYQSNGETPGMIISARTSNSSMAEKMAVLTEEEIIFYKLAGEFIETAERYSWDDWTDVTVDHYAVKTELRFEDGTVIDFLDGDKKAAVEYIRKNTHINVNVLERKFYNKIPGFRSMKRWKMVTASIGYFILFVIIAGMFTGGDDDSLADEDNNNNSVNEVNNDENDEVVEENDNNNNENNADEPEIQNIDFDADVAFDNDEVTIEGTTNFVDGTIISYEIEHYDDMDYFIDGEMEVEDGSFSATIDISDFPNGTISAYYTFVGYNQNEEIQELYGPMGEYIEGDSVEGADGQDTKYIAYEELYVKSEPIEITGTGDTATESFTLSDGFAVLEFTHSGSRNFAVQLTDEFGSQSLVVNEIGNYTGTNFELTDAGEYLLDITADGEWTANITQTIPQDVEEEEPHSLSGSGDDVVFIELESGMKRVESTHDGDSNFVVMMNGSSLLVNEIGSYSGSTTQTVQDDSIYVISVNADGNWTVEIE